MTPVPARPWDRPAPEWEGRPSAWSLFPEDLAALGCPGSALETFKRLHRPWTWLNGAPELGSGIRRWLEGTADLSLPSIADRQPSADGATKLALALVDGQRIEAVHMPRRVRNPRVTYCLSSQVGCAMGCIFCATGSMGILRNLSAGEILGQVFALMMELGPDRGHELTLVFMGMGEPLHNLENLVELLRTCGLPVFPKSIYGLDQIPWRVVPGDITLVAAAVIVFCSLASFIPAWRAARMDPVQALRKG